MRLRYPPWRLAGWLPVQSAIIPIGLWVITLSFNSSRHSEPWAMSLFWAGVVLMWLPATLRILDPGVTRLETIWLLTLITVASYLIPLLRQPISVLGFDEFLHWRTADDIIRTHHLYTPNAMLPISPLYPGLEIVTSAMVGLTGLNVAEAGLLCVGLGRAILVASLFVIYEKLTGSFKAAGIGVLIYMGGSTFVFFDSQFAYESLGVPMGVLTIYLIWKRSVSPPQEGATWTTLALVCMMATIAVHHVSAYMTTGFVLLWTLTTSYVNSRAPSITLRDDQGLRGAISRLYRGTVDEPRGEGPGRVILHTEPDGSWRARGYHPKIVWLSHLFIAANILWLVVVAGSTIAYLAPHAQEGVVSLQQLLTGEVDKQAVSAPTSSGGVNYERYVGMVSVALLMMGLSLGLWKWWRQRLYSPLALALALSAAAYPAIPAMRLFEATWEISNRLAAFLFLGLGYVIGLGLISVRLGSPARSIRPWAVSAAIVLAICGGIIGGSNPSTRLPAPYVAAADERSIDDEGIAASEWAYRLLGANNRMAGDRVMASLMSSYGRQWMVWRPSDGVNISGIFLSPKLQADERKIIQSARIRYLVIDRRISEVPPLYGFYFESWEQMVIPFEPPAQLAVLDKFFGMPGVSCVFDSGDIRIYDVGGIPSEP